MEVATYMPYQHRTFQPSYHPHYAPYPDPRAQTSHPVSVGSTVASQYAPEAARNNERAMDAAISQTSHVSEEVNKPSLPSIAKLLDGMGADGERASVTHRDNAVPVTQQQHQSYYNTAQTDASLMPTYSSPSDHSMPQRTTIAPTPPPLGRSDSVLDPANSPSVMSQSSVSAANYFMGTSLNNVDPHQQRIASMIKRHPQGASMYGTPSYAIPQYTSSSPSAMSTSSYFSNDGIYPVNGLYHQQRQLPSNFPPTMSGPLVSAPGVQAAGVWESHHHHYINPSSHTPYPQSQDRYICPEPMCRKAFSRPSSLKIHSHSHSGEKPYQCSHVGCGKAFSVRSNMKRHERGCHVGSSSIMGGM